MTDETRGHTRLGAYGVALRENEVLLVLKSRGPYLGGWDLPSGRVEFGESPEEAVARELEEETGLQIAGDPQLIAALSPRCLVSNGGSAGRTVSPGFHLPHRPERRTAKTLGTPREGRCRNSGVGRL